MRLWDRTKEGWQYSSYKFLMYGKIIWIKDACFKKCLYVLLSVNVEFINLYYIYYKYYISGSNKTLNVNWKIIENPWFINCIFFKIVVLIFWGYIISISFYPSFISLTREKPWWERNIYVKLWEEHNLVLVFYEIKVSNRSRYKKMTAKGVDPRQRPLHNQV